MTRNLVLAITGGSGAVYAVRLLQVLVAAGYDVHLSISQAGQAVLVQELSVAVDLDNFAPDLLLRAADRLYDDDPVEHRFDAALPAEGQPAQVEGHDGSIRYYHYNNFMAPIASGSFLTDGMVICPCSTGTVSAVATGASRNLIHRAADVHLKERRKLVLVPRETPLSVIQLDNLKRCAEAGAVVLPAMPGWYHGVNSLADLVDFVVARICDQLGVPNKFIQRWGE